MKKIIAIAAIALPLAFSANAQWIVYDPTMNVQQILDEAESIAKYVTMIDNQVQQLTTLNNQLSEFKNYESLFGSPSQVSLSMVPALNSDLQSVEPGQNLGNLVSNANGNIALTFNNNGIYATVGTSFQTPKGQTIQRPTNQYQRFSAIINTASNYITVADNAAQRRATIKTNIAQTLQQLQTATNDAQVQKLHAVLTGLNSDLSSTDDEVNQAATSALVQDIQNRNDQEKQVQALVEQKNADFTEAISNYVTTFQLLDSLLPSPPNNRRRASLMATFTSIFPTFLTLCGQLNSLLLSVAYAFFITGIIITVYHQFTHETVLRLMIRIIVLTCLLVYLPVWGNALQQLLQDSIISGLGVDPSQVYQQFLNLLIINRDPSTPSSWWNVLSQLHNISTDLIVTVVLWLVGQFASVMMFWAYIFQQVVLNMGYALSPLLIGFMAIPALKQTGERYLLNLVGVLLWPLGWAVAALVTQGMLDFISNPSLEYMDPSSQLPDLQKTFGTAALGFWIIFSTIAAPVIIQKVIASGALAATELFSAGASTALQTAASAVSGAVAAAPIGPFAAVAAGGAAGAAGMLSSSANIGNAGSLVSGLAQLSSSKSDPSGDRAVRQLLEQLLQHFGQLSPIAPVNGLPPKL